VVTETTRGATRVATRCHLVQFESRPDDSDLGRLVDSTIWINDAHPAYVRAAASRSLGHHTAVVVAVTLARSRLKRATSTRSSHNFWRIGAAPRRRERRRDDIGGR
jgi:hypothetical protein